MIKIELIATLSLGLITACSSVVPPEVSQGDITKQTLLTTEQSFSNNYQSYKVSEKDLALIKQWPNGIHFDIYFGSWCHDSEREVPKLLKLLQENKALSYRLIALNYRKTEPKGRAKAANVVFTPTVIVKKAGKELGRIIERPNVSLVADIEGFIKKHSN